MRTVACCGAREHGDPLNGDGMHSRSLPRYREAMGLAAWLLLGLIAGLVARLIVPGPSGRGCCGIIVTIVIGLVGAVVGGFIGVQLGWGEVSDFDLRSIALAVLGAIVVLIVLAAIRER